MPLRYFLFVALLPACLAASAQYLIGYSTGGHFSCSGVSCPPSSTALSETALTTLIERLGTPSSSSNFDLPVSADFSIQSAPEVTLVVYATGSESPRTLLDKLSAATESEHATSFVSRASELSASGETQTVAQLRELVNAEGVAMFANGKQDVLQVSVSAGEVSDLMNAMGTIARRSSGQVAIVWSGRQDAATDGDAKPEVDTNAGEGDGQKDSEGDAKVDENAMRRPEISEAGLAGLIVVFVFLVLFVPGFMCLWNIQPPQTFEMMDSTDMKKKLQ